MKMGKISDKRVLIVCITIAGFLSQEEKILVTGTMSLAGHEDPLPRSWKSRW